MNLSSAYCGGQKTEYPLGGQSVSASLRLFPRIERPNFVLSSAFDSERTGKLLRRSLRMLLG